MWNSTELSYILIFLKYLLKRWHWIIFNSRKKFKQFFFFLEECCTLEKYKRKKIIKAFYKNWIWGYKSAFLIEYESGKNNNFLSRENWYIATQLPVRWSDVMYLQYKVTWQTQMGKHWTYLTTVSQVIRGYQR